MENFKASIPIAIGAAVRAGGAILRIYDAPDFDPQTELKGDASPLTAADKAAHRVIAEALSKTPWPVLSEEGRDIPYAERQSWETFWLVDPLDGTKEFIKRNGEFTVNIALIRQGVPVFGVIYVPVSGMLYWGDKDNGAWKAPGIGPGESGLTIESLTAKAIRLPRPTENRPYTIVASRSHRDENTEAYIREKEREHRRVEIISCGSSLKICLVAEGAADDYPRFGPTMEWDTGAGDAIARAAGAEMTVFGTGEPMSYNKENLLNPWFIVRKPANP